MGSADCIECRIDAGAANSFRREFTHRSNEVTSAIVNCGSTKSLNCIYVRCSAGTDCLEAKMTREIEQRRTNRA